MGSNYFIYIHLTLLYTLVYNIFPAQTFLIRFMSSHLVGSVAFIYSGTQKCNPIFLWQTRWSRGCLTKSVVIHLMRQDILKQLELDWKYNWDNVCKLHKHVKSKKKFLWFGKNCFKVHLQVHMKQGTINAWFCLDFTHTTKPSWWKFLKITLSYYIGCVSYLVDCAK